ncbi:hypothetical protein [Hydrogenovibrio sp. JE_KL2]|uniref:hypothetical protein n=1 Tax=Hydrogenovibrio sp. JE_KL2 TaxID=2651188 RepID=UPI00128E38F1|nr:hypothetical protein [Hydrogenovibrio sp. JE_KL2]MPQ76391.1 hypothetical protein [Hydrogenovibrio sp. JE_KL2]
MKQFLRYQISGTVFIIWALLFYISWTLDIYSNGMPDEFFQLFLSCAYDAFHESIWILAFSALPIGVLIHQFSVIIKNLFGLRLLPALSDRPRIEILNGFELSHERTQYITEHISNLNSFYYVRVDNGLLAPLLAFITVSFIYGYPNIFLTTLAVIIGFITLAYVPRIYCELKQYYSCLDTQ